MQQAQPSVVFSMFLILIRRLKMEYLTQETTSKVCSLCGQDKFVEEFSPKKGGKNELHHWCRSCKRIKDAAYSRDAYSRNPERIRSKNKKWCDENREQDLSRKRKYNAEHKKEIYSKQLECRAKNINQYRKVARERISRKKMENPNFKVTCLIRTRIRNALDGRAKSGRSVELLGCSWDEARKYIESKFQPGMSWKNHGVRGWHIDHVVPCAAFDLTDPEQQRMCFHYTNLQPLWAKDNLSKGANFSHQRVAGG
jgi:hypothetical protein